MNEINYNEYDEVNERRHYRNGKLCREIIILVKRNISDNIHKIKLEFFEEYPDLKYWHDDTYCGCYSIDGEGVYRCLCCDKVIAKVKRLYSEYRDDFEKEVLLVETINRGYN